MIYSLKLPVPAPGNITLFENIGADGQHGVSRTASAGLSNESNVLSGTTIAGPGSEAVDSDWNGSAAFPLPQLWDDTGHDATPQAPAGTTALNFSIASAGGSTVDCLTPVANIVSLQ